MTTLSELIRPFITSVAAGEIDIYNEFSLQHELGIFLRNRLPEDKVQFERNVGSFFPGNVEFTKREIDLVVCSRETGERKWAIELKFPRNGQYPETMFSFCRDVAFAEELKSAGFAQSGLVIFAEDQLFYRGSASGIYGYFRGGLPLTGLIQKPTGAKDSQVTVRGSYAVQWIDIAGPLKYAVVET